MKLIKYAFTRAKIFLAQDFRKIASTLLQSSKKTTSDPLKFISGLNHFYHDRQKDKQALITLPAWAWEEALSQEPNIKNFNFTGLLYEMVRGLNANGYLVDVLDLNTHDFKVEKDYDILIGHGGSCKPIIQQLKPNTTILQYVSGAYYETFIKESNSRYKRFQARNKLLQPIEHKRRMDHLVEGEHFLTEKAHYLFSCNAPRMVATFGRASSKFFFTGLAAYINQDFVIDRTLRNYNEGKKNFIYVGGTSGNIQKGADLIIEAFANKTEANLYIFCELESEILINYKKELSLPNIKYIYHYRYFPQRLKRLLKKVNYSIHAPINTGIGTAFAGTMGIGLIPVGYIDIASDSTWNVLTSKDDVDSLCICIETSMNKDEGWCASASDATIDYFHNNWSVNSFSKKFEKLINKVTNGQ